MKPTKEQIRKLGYQLCKTKTTNKNCEYCWFYNAPRTCHNTLRHYIEEAKWVITEWEKTKEINKQTKEPQVKIPNDKDLEFLAYALPWRLHALLPSKHEDRDILISEIIELWEKIRCDK